MEYCSWFLLSAKLTDATMEKYLYQDRQVTMVDDLPVYKTMINNYVDEESYSL